MENYNIDVIDEYKEQGFMVAVDHYNGQFKPVQLHTFS